MIPVPILAALEHARDPGVDPALPVLAVALEESWARQIARERVYRRMDALLRFVFNPARPSGRRSRSRHSAA